MTFILPDYFQSLTFPDGNNFLTKLKLVSTTLRMYKSMQFLTSQLHQLTFVTTYASLTKLSYNSLFMLRIPALSKLQEFQSVSVSSKPLNCRSSVSHINYIYVQQFLLIQLPFNFDKMLIYSSLKISYESSLRRIGFLKTPVITKMHDECHIA